MEYLRGQDQKGEDLRNVCLVARTVILRNDARDAVRAAGIPSVLIEAEGGDRQAKGVRIATMHRVKGLEFDRVVLVSANKNVLPLSGMMHRAAGEMEMEAAETKERALTYVATSRARQEVLVLSFGKPSSFLAPGDAGQ